MLLDRFPILSSPLGIVSIAVGGVLILCLIEWLILSVPLPEGIALVREPEGARRFSLKTRLAYYSECEALFREAYVEYIKKGKPVIIPGFGFRYELVMPQSSMKWVLAQSDDVLSVDHAFAEVDQARWSLGHEKYVVDAWQGSLVKADLNRVLESICAAMNNELGVAFDEGFGTDTENCNEIDLNETLQMVIAQAASRFTVGLPLCREKEYLRISLKINQLLILTAGLVGGLPKVLRPFVGSFLNLRILLLINKIKAFFLPLWRERKETLAWDRDDPNHDEPQDHIQMMLRYAHRERPDDFHDEESMTRRLITANFGSMHQTQIQVTNLILNVLGSDAEFNTIAILRDEAERVLGPGNADWTKNLVNQLTRADSVSRETLRLQSFGGRSTFRKVMTSDCTTPDGCRLPKGVLLSFLSQPAHLDPDTLDEPAKFDPFRYSRIRELAASRDEKVPLISLVSTSPEFLPFGHGKHACPGRFLIDFELKMILAYVLKHYDIAFPEKYEGKRPPNVWLTEAVVPPAGVRIKVRRRTKVSS